MKAWQPSYPVNQGQVGSSFWHLTKAINNAWKWWANEKYEELRMIREQASGCICICEYSFSWNRQAIEQVSAGVKTLQTIYHD